MQLPYKNPIQTIQKTFETNLNSDVGAKKKSDLLLFLLLVVFCTGSILFWPPWTQSPVETDVKISEFNSSAFSHNITYDRRSIIINGERMLLLAGAVHYPRSTPSMWPQIFRLAKEAGLNVIDTYVFWNVHEPEKGIFNFKGIFQFMSE